MKRHPIWLGLIAAAALAHVADTAHAQVTEIVVGVTPNCPYGFPACWSSAKEALQRLDGIEMVASTPDSFNCTARVLLKHKGLPDLRKWQKQFNTLVGDVHRFRGVEITVLGSVVSSNGQLVLRTPGLADLKLAPLENKLQWNFKKRAARQPEPDERRGYGQLAAKRKKTKSDSFQVEVTGPLQQTDRGLIMEVREFFLIPPILDRAGRTEYP